LFEIGIIEMNKEVFLYASIRLLSPGISSPYVWMSDEFPGLGDNQRLADASRI
jgi:hypothetical protein